MKTSKSIKRITYVELRGGIEFYSTYEIKMADDPIRVCQSSNHYRDNQLSHGALIGNPSGCIDGMELRHAFPGLRFIKFEDGRWPIFELNGETIQLRLDGEAVIV